MFLFFFSFPGSIVSPEVSKCTDTTKVNTATFKLRILNVFYILDQFD